ncbi:MAG: FoF1 ATP synthase subunit a [Candidatus Acidiferrales bacterium]
MKEQVDWFTGLVNKYLGALALKLLVALHITPENPNLPIPNYIAASLLVCIIAAVFFLWLRPRIRADRPGATQQVMEMLLTNPMGVGIRDLLDENIEHNARQYLPLVGSLSIFILFASSISAIPGFVSPTSHPAVPLACAIMTFLYYNWSGLRELGAVGYAKQFAGPVPALSWLIFPVEIISHTARLLSLTVRLWANIFASELIYLIFLALSMAPRQAVLRAHPNWSMALAIFPAVIPIVFLLLHLFVAVVQSFVFTILPSLYIGMATSHEH